jgi:hypothetical protein
MSKSESPKKRKSLRSRVMRLVKGWEQLEQNLKELPSNHPMRVAIPSLNSCKEQLKLTIENDDL